MTTKTTILIVDDEQMVRRLIGDALARSGYAIELAGSGSEAIKRLVRPGICLMLLDLQLGDMDGVAVMERARELWPDLPIIMLTAHGSLPSAIAAVRHGAADYLLKPTSMDELRTRVAAALSRRTLADERSTRLRSMYSEMQALLQSEGLIQAVGEVLPAEDTHMSGPLRIDVRRHVVKLHDHPIDVTPTEFAILVELLRQPDMVISCSQLTQAINTPVDDEEEARQIIRPHIGRLRRKLELEPQQPRYLISVRGFGYRWVGDGTGVDG